MKDSNLKALQMNLSPVGKVNSEIKVPILRAGETDIELKERMDTIREHHKKLREIVCEIVILPEYENLLDGIEDFSHILVLYWPHLIDPERRKLQKVHPMGRQDLPLKGIFSTCSPARPNPVLVSAVRLLERHGNILKVEGLEAVDGSPVIDIKPYVHYYGAKNPTVPEWMAQIQQELEIDKN